MTEPAGETYVVRIYRRDQADPTRMSGTVENIQAGTQQRFNEVAALLAVLLKQESPPSRTAAFSSGRSGRKSG